MTLTGGEIMLKVYPHAWVTRFDRSIPHASVPATENPQRVRQFRFRTYQLVALADVSVSVVSIVFCALLAAWGSKMVPLTEQHYCTTLARTRYPTGLWDILRFIDLLCVYSLPWHLRHSLGGLMLSYLSLHCSSISWICLSAE
jgi:hypothetical protein